MKHFETKVGGNKSTPTPGEKKKRQKQKKQSHMDLPYLSKEESREMQTEKIK